MIVESQAVCPQTPVSAIGPPDVETARFTPFWFGANGIWAGGLARGHVFAGLPPRKVLWYREHEGQLRVGGTRLDAPAPPALIDLPSGYGDRGNQASTLYFPTEGCWEIVAGLTNRELHFVIYVRPAADNALVETWSPPAQRRVLVDVPLPGSISLLVLRLDGLGTQAPQIQVEPAPKLERATVVVTGFAREATGWVGLVGVVCPASAVGSAEPGGHVSVSAGGASFHVSALGIADQGGVPRVRLPSAGWTAVLLAGGAAHHEMSADALLAGIRHLVSEGDERSLRVLLRSCE